MEKTNRAVKNDYICFRSVLSDKQVEKANKRIVEHNACFRVALSVLSKSSKELDAMVMKDANENGEATTGILDWLARGLEMSKSQVEMFKTTQARVLAAMQNSLTRLDSLPAKKRAA